MPYRAMWQTLEARICAVRKEGKSKLLSMRASLTAEEASNSSVLVDHPSLDVTLWIERVPASFLDELLVQLRDSKTLTVGGRSLTLEAFDNSSRRCDEFMGRHLGYLGQG